jgi:hypothetical protein
MTDSAARTVEVSKLSERSTEASVKQFFGFCGAVESVKFDATAHTATVVFAKQGSAKTASFLNGS